ncbi:hypothetical protein MUY14_26285 [Amycolatopsis sp. FBCC-B4732]|uniref:hypothetical protein n=1 Tax=Amycolatopsis sp. FBCC-B4732 TaxID=3079339 RepID=UPI001FF617CF|nr:hypothetical protein [Amycolatopsis sp. FBCC-B4732]UOX85300.1 hypothetical protein MUY14_26285 [Amycolatopsis sp. FBCC-B4732]
MKLTIIIAAAALTLAACSSTSTDIPASPTGSEPVAEKVTLTVGGLGADQIAYTDPTASGGVRTEQIPGLSTPVSHKITVDKGSTVSVTLSGFADRPVTECTITDATDQVVYIRGKDQCTYVAN